MNNPSELITSLPMRIGLGTFSDPSHERLSWIRQIGVRDILLNFYRTPLIDTQTAFPLTGAEEWGFQELVRLRNRVEDYGLRLNAIENVPKHFTDKLMLGKPGRERQLECLQRTVQNMARAGIPYFGYYWDPTDVLRSSTSHKIRGGAETMSINPRDYENAPLLLDREYSEEEMWEYYHYFLEGILPVAESEGIKLAAHPVDPPVPKIGGVPRLLRSRAAFDKAFALRPSANHGCEFCLGNWAAMGEDIPAVIEHFAAQDKIFYVHFQTISNCLPEPLHEVFVDEPGYYDPLDILKKLRDSGFRGLVIPGHVPIAEGDSRFGEKSNCFTVGYLRGILRTLDRLDPRAGCETLDAENQAHLR